MVTFIEPAAPGRDLAAIEAAIRVLTQKFGNRLVTSQAVREQHGNTTDLDREPAARRGGVSAEHRRRAGDRAHLRRRMACR